MSISQYTVGGEKSDTSHLLNYFPISIRYTTSLWRQWTVCILLYIFIDRDASPMSDIFSVFLFFSGVWAKKFCK